MGLFRVVLALSVLIAHSGCTFLGLRFFDGQLAVETFFIVSGFYMALILSTRYQSDTGSFYFNRFLRLFPSYWILLAAIVFGSGAYWAITGHLTRQMLEWGRYPGGWTVWITTFAANILIVGTDVLAWFRGGVYSYYLVVPAIWSVAVEIVFYLFAPVIVRASLATQLLLFLVGLLLRQSLWMLNGSHWTVWSYCFAPATTPFFLSGILAYRLYTAVLRTGSFGQLVRPIGYLLELLLILLVCLQNQFDFLGSWRWAYYSIVCGSLPFIFAATKDQRSDSFLGQWSYPIYLAHQPILVWYSYVEGFAKRSLKVYFIVALTMAASTFVGHCDQYIQRRFKRRI